MGFDFGISSFNVGLQRLADREARKWSQQQSDTKWERDLEMRDYQNWYNSPEEQMKRWEDAGLNKNLIYGQGTPGNMSSSPSYSKAPGKFSAFSLGNPEDNIQAYANFRKTMSESEQVAQTTNNIKLHNQLMGNTMQTQIESKIKELEIKKSNAKTAAEKAKTQLEITKLTSEKAATQKHQNRLWKENINPNDDLLIRQAARWLDDIREFWKSPKESSGMLPVRVKQNKN